MQSMKLALTQFYLSNSNGIESYVFKVEFFTYEQYAFQNNATKLIYTDQNYFGIRVKLTIYINGHTLQFALSKVNILLSNSILAYYKVLPSKSDIPNKNYELKNVAKQVCVNNNFFNTVFNDASTPIFGSKR